MLLLLSLSNALGACLVDEILPRSARRQLVGLLGVHQAPLCCLQIDLPQEEHELLAVVHVAQVRQLVKRAPPWPSTSQ